MAIAAPNVIAIGFLTVMVQHQSMKIVIPPTKTAESRLVGNGSLPRTISAARMLAGMPSSRNCRVRLVLWKYLSEPNISLVLLIGLLADFDISSMTPARPFLGWALMPASISGVTLLRVASCA